jgi:uncharacterized protein YjiS (DUF1127 family)
MHGEIYGKSMIIRRHTGSASTLGATVAKAFTRLVDGIFDWQERARSRRMLAALDDRMLHDIGIDRATAQRESATAFWR